MFAGVALNAAAARDLAAWPAAEITVDHGNGDGDQIRGGWFLTLNVLVLMFLMGCWAVAAVAYVLS